MTSQKLVTTATVLTLSRNQGEAADVVAVDFPRFLGFFGKFGGRWGCEIGKMVFCNFAFFLLHLSQFLFYSSKSQYSKGFNAVTSCDKPP